MLSRLPVLIVVAGCPLWTSAAAVSNDEQGVRRFIADWNTAYTSMDAAKLVALQTPDYEMIDRFGHWIHSKDAGFYRQLWSMTFSQIYKCKPGPRRTIEEVRFLPPWSLWCRHAPSILTE
jgi:ketosteroid isomerase-like protein